MTASAPLDFIHEFVPGRSGRTLLLLHGTGGNESDLLPLGAALDPEAALLSPRGNVLENKMPRFFRRLAEGVFDEEDLVRRTHELARFIEQAAAHYGFDQRKLLAMGYSNGANIAGALLLLRPGVVGGAALLRPMVPLIPETPPDLQGAPVLVAAGNQDPIAPAENARRLVALLRQAGADVTVSFEDAGHGLTENTVETARRWLAEKVK
ncbi:MAG: alpha/beta hydrolase [Verrucomicrobiota bacterium]|nr:alpha/beta hydrolase [Verrucomicrobiota bacterium]